MAPLTYEQVSIYFRARTRRAQDPRKDFILYIYSTLFNYARIKLILRHSR